MQTDPDERFDAVVEAFAGDVRVVPPTGGRGFGRSALRIDGRIFAMFVRGRFVLKLPQPRVDELVDAGAGVRFDANKGTPMKEWFSLDPTSSLDWPALARDALAHVSLNAPGRSSSPPADRSTTRRRR